jgi:hypothetical protein
MQFPVSPLVIGLDLPHLPEGIRHLGKSLFIRFFGKEGVERPPFELLSLGRGLQVLDRRTGHTSRVGSGDFSISSSHELPEELGMLHLVIRGLLENRRYLFKSFLLRTLGKETIPCPRL